MKKQTAVEWLVEQMINKMGIRIENTTIGVELFEQAQGMFEEQIIDAFDEGNPHAFIPKDGQQYFNETFKQQTPMSKQTAVEWLQVQLNENGKLSAVDFYQAKEIEKEQRLDFAKHCLDKAKDLDVRTAFFNVEQYYNETFNTKQK